MPRNAQSNVLSVLVCAMLVASIFVVTSSIPSNQNAFAGTFPGVNGKIAFDSYRDVNGEVYVMDADGTGQTNLSSNTAADGVPDWGAASPIQLTEDLEDTVNGLAIPGKLKTSLLGPLHNIEKILTDGDPTNDHTACEKLDSFISSVEAKTGKKGGLTQADADELIGQAQAIKDAIGC